MAFASFFCLTDVFQLGVWKDMQAIVDPHLKSLAAELPTIALRAKQDGTITNYRYGWERWRRWASQYDEVSVFPAQGHFVALYLLELYHTSRTPAPVNLAYYAISWAHRMAGLPDPTVHTLPKMVREAAPRTLVKFSNKKEPVTIHMLKEIVRVFGKPAATLMDLRVSSMCLIAFAGFLRYQEIANLKRCDIIFESQYVRLFLEQSKTDVYRNGV